MFYYFIMYFLAKQFMAEIPPYEVFIVKHQDKVKRHIYESIKPGDIIYATIPRNKLSSTKFGLPVNAVCTGEPKVQLLHEYKLKVRIVKFSKIISTIL